MTVMLRGKKKAGILVCIVCIYFHGKNQERFSILKSLQTMTEGWSEKEKENFLKRCSYSHQFKILIA